MRKFTFLMVVLLFFSSCTTGATPSPPIEATATVRPVPTDTPTATATLKPSPTATPNPVPYTVKLTNVDIDYLKQIYQIGQQQGRDAHRFTKVGDCQSIWVEFMQGIDTGEYNLGPYGYLEEVIPQFSGSYSHVGQSNILGNYVTVLLDPLWADPRICEKGENPLECEYRDYNPSIALIFIEPRLVAGGWQKTYHDGLTTIVKDSLDRGIIPILSTQFLYKDHEEFIADTNQIIATVAEEQNVPLWDFGPTVAHLPNGGDEENWHLSRMPNSNNMNFGDPKSFDYGTPYRNLQALEVLDFIWRNVMR